MIASPRSTVVSRETDAVAKAKNDLLDAVRTHLVEGTSNHIATVESAVHALRDLLHLKETIHVIYTHNNYHLRTAIVQLALNTGLATKTSSQHWNGKTLLRSHPIFALDLDSLKAIWALPHTQQKRMLVRGEWCICVVVVRLHAACPVSEQCRPSGQDDATAHAAANRWHECGPTCGQVTSLCHVRKCCFG